MIRQEMRFVVNQKDHMIEKILELNRREHLFQPGDGIVVGLSGGADSVCLLSLFVELREEWDLALYAIHIHHGLRGSEADRDAGLAGELAQQWNVPFRLVRADIRKLAQENGWTEEEAGRRFRYDAFEKYRQETGADRIAVAHHEDDQAETVLFHLFRGTGPRGLAGIPARRGAVIRPLLGVSRVQIESYIEEAGLLFATDQTNQIPAYSRNKIRLQLLPWVKEELNPQAVRHIAEAAQKMAKLRDYIEEQGKCSRLMMTEEGPGMVRLDTEALRKLPDVMQTEVIRQIFAELIPGAKDISQIHFRNVEKLAGMAAGSRQLFPGGVTAVREYGCICFRTQTGPGTQTYLECNPPCTHILQINGRNMEFYFEVKKRRELTGEIPQKDYTKWLDYDMIKGSLVLRNPSEGDYLILNSQGDKKKLARYYIDRKIPRDDRATQIVLADGGHVLWAVPERISAACKISERTENILVITKTRDLP